MAVAHIKQINASPLRVVISHLLDRHEIPTENVEAFMDTARSTGEKVQHVLAGVHEDRHNGEDYFGGRQDHG